MTQQLPSYCNMSEAITAQIIEWLVALDKFDIQPLMSYSHGRARFAVNKQGRRGRQFTVGVNILEKNLEVSMFGPMGFSAVRHFELADPASMTLLHEFVLEAIQTVRLSWL